MKRRVAILVTALLVLGAGCIGSVPDDFASANNATTTDTANSSTTATPANNTTTATPANNTTTATPANNSTTTTPTNNSTTTDSTSNSTTTTEESASQETGADDEASASGASVDAASGASVDAATIASEHVAALRDAGSFTRRTDVQVEASGANGSMDAAEFADVGLSLPATVAVDLDRGRLRSTADVGIVSLTDYASFDEGMVYRRLGGNGTETTYRAMDASECSYPATGAALLEHLQRATEHRLVTANFAVAGMVEYRGTEVTKLVADGVSDHDLEDGNGTRFLDAKTVVLVGPDGLVQRVERHRTFESFGATVRQTVVVEYVALGETTVEEPSWLDEARDGSSG